MTDVAADWPPENAIVALFRQWVAAENEAEALGQRDAEDGTPEQAEFEAASERTTDLVDAIAAIPSRGPVGLAIKVYLRHRFGHGGGRYGDPPATLGEFEADDSERALEQSIIEDAVRFVPELAPLAAAAIGPDESEAA